jgi:hypothetical protein
VEKAEQYPEHRYGWDGEDNAEAARDLAPGNDGHEDQDRGDLQGLSLDPGRQDVALQLLVDEENKGREKRRSRRLEEEGQKEGQNNGRDRPKKTPM